MLEQLKKLGALYEDEPVIETTKIEILRLLQEPDSPEVQKAITDLKDMISLLEKRSNDCGNLPRKRVVRNFSPYF
jgi:hypothetical protein